MMKNDLEAEDRSEADGSELRELRASSHRGSYSRRHTSKKPTTTAVVPEQPELFAYGCEDEVAVATGCNTGARTQSAPVRPPRPRAMLSLTV